MKKSFNTRLILGVITIITLAVIIYTYSLLINMQNQGIEIPNKGQFSLLTAIIFIGLFITFLIAWRAQLEIDSKVTMVKDKSESKEVNNKDSDKEKEKNIKEQIDKNINSIFKNLKYDDVNDFSEKIIKEVSRKIELGAAASFIKKDDNKYYLQSQWAIILDKDKPHFELGEGIHGQAAKNQKFIALNNISQNILFISSSSGKTNPKSLYVMPFIIDGDTKYLFEFASLKTNNEIELESMKAIYNKLQQLFKAQF